MFWIVGTRNVTGRQQGAGQPQAAPGQTKEAGAPTGSHPSPTRPGRRRRRRARRRSRRPPLPAAGPPASARTSACPPAARQPPDSQCQRACCRAMQNSNLKDGMMRSGSRHEQARAAPTGQRGSRHRLRAARPAGGAAPHLRSSTAAERRSRYGSNGKNISSGRRPPAVGPAPPPAAGAGGAQSASRQRRARRPNSATTVGRQTASGASLRPAR